MPTWHASDKCIPTFVNLSFGNISSISTFQLIHEILSLYILDNNYIKIFDKNNQLITQKKKIILKEKLPSK